MTIDEQDLRSLADKLRHLYVELDTTKYNPPPQRERVMKPRPGPSSPGNWLAMALDRDMTADLFEMVRDAANYCDPTAVIHHQGKWLCEWIRLKAFYIVEDFPAADDLADLMRDQVRRLDKRLHPEGEEVEVNADPYLTARSIQRALACRGHACPEGTVRRWASEGEVETRRVDGRTLYRLRDVQERISLLR